MTENLDDILKEIKDKKHTWETDVELPAETEAQVREERQSKVSSFKLDLDLEGEFGAYTPDPPAEPQPEAKHAAAPEEPAPAPQKERVKPEKAEKPEKPEKPEKKPKKRRMDARSREMWGCAGGVFYVLLVLGVALLMAAVIIMAALDLTGLNKSAIEVPVVVEEGTTLDEMTDILAENGLIRQKWFFKAYCFISGNKTYKPGVYSLAPNMGYGNIVDSLRAGPPRTVVKVTIPEGYTVDAIAALLEEKGVCTKASFYEAVRSGDFSEYSFVNAIPPAEGEDAGRSWRLEGYLFPDTYEFYTGSTGEAAVNKLLNNFDNRVDTSYRARIAAAGFTVHEAVTLASIVQAEAAGGEWSRVSRVLLNRLADPANYPNLQCESTINYFKKLDRTVAGQQAAESAYDTSVRKGLTPGAICNPGMRAIEAVLNPSTNKSIVDCYFFATDYSDGTTYYSKTYAEHMAICKKYKIGIYAEPEE